MYKFDGIVVIWMNKIIAIIIILLSGLSLAANERCSETMVQLPPPTINSSKTEKFSIYYICDSIDININYLGNKEQIEHILDYLQRSPRIDSITIYAWASPEGGYNRNKWLSRERALTAKRFLLAHSPDSSRLNSNKIKISPLAENWPGLLESVEQDYHRHDREKVLEILRNDRIGDETRKWRLKQLDKGYTWRYLIRRHMPQLRAATWFCVWAEAPEKVQSIDRPSDTLKAIETPLPPFRQTPPPIKAKRTILGLKTNLLYDAFSVLNFAVEIPFNKHFSILYEHHCPWWLSDNNRYCLQFLSFGGEARWWFAPRTSFENEERKLRDALVGHFLGVYGWGGKSDIQANRDFGCYQFEFISAGLTYGYSMPVSRYLNLEFSISAGYARIPYRHYVPTPDWEILVRDHNNAGTLHYFGPTKAEISLVIPIRATVRPGRKGGQR